jgi:DNA-binding transcriptional regulator YiaG
METAELRVDSELLFEAIDRKRRHLRMTRMQVSALLGVTTGRYTQWGLGGGIGSDAALRACVWLDRDFRNFIKKDAA